MSGGRAAKMWLDEIKLQRCLTFFTRFLPPVVCERILNKYHTVADKAADNAVTVTLAKLLKVYGVKEVLLEEELEPTYLRLWLQHCGDGRWRTAQDAALWAYVEFYLDARDVNSRQKRPSNFQAQAPVSPGKAGSKKLPPMSQVGPQAAWEYQPPSKERRTAGAPVVPQGLEITPLAGSSQASTSAGVPFSQGGYQQQSCAQAGPPYALAGPQYAQAGPPPNQQFQYQNQWWSQYTTNQQPGNNWNTNQSDQEAMPVGTAAPQQTRVQVKVPAAVSTIKDKRQAGKRTSASSKVESTDTVADNREGEPGAQKRPASTGSSQLEHQ